VKLCEAKCEAGEAVCESSFTLVDCLFMSVYISKNGVREAGEAVFCTLWVSLDFTLCFLGEEREKKREIKSVRRYQRVCKTDSPDSHA